jgi:hypothetical protein
VKTTSPENLIGIDAFQDRALACRTVAGASVSKMLEGRFHRLKRADLVFDVVDFLDGQFADGCAVGVLVDAE